MSKYHTILTEGYSSQHGDDNRACGAVTHTEIAKTASGYRIRHTDSNGRYQSSSKSSPIAHAEVSRILGVAEVRAKNDRDNAELAYIERMRATLGVAE